MFRYDSHMILMFRILMFRIMKEDLDIRREDLFPCAKLTSTRGHNLKVNHGKPANLEIRRRFYSQRVVVPWNELPQHIVVEQTTRARLTLSPQDARARESSAQTLLSVTQ